MSLRYYPFAALPITVAASALYGFLPANIAAPLLVGLVLTALLAGWLCLALALDRAHVLAPETQMGSPAVDPWAMQRHLMDISHQHIAAAPAFTNTSVLYAALLLEELGETMGHLRAAAELLRQERDHLIPSTVAPDLAQTFDHLQQELQAGSLTIRRILEGRWSFFIHLPESLAMALFDDTTDVAVVNCGFAVASGFDGAEGYREVAGSNISKANPDTGVIDRTPDGKWIKGRRYRSPDLRSVMSAHAALTRSRMQAAQVDAAMSE